MRQLRPPCVDNRELWPLIASLDEECPVGLGQPKLVGPHVVAGVAEIEHRLRVHFVREEVTERVPVRR